MKVSLATIACAVGTANAFTTTSPLSVTKFTTANPKTVLSMALDMPPADVPQVQALPGNAPTPVRYSDFLKLVNADRVEKVTFSSDGTQLLGVDVNGVRLAIEALPNDPDLLTQLTQHKVDVTVLPANEGANGLADLAQSLFFPLALFAGLFFLSRRGGMNGMGGGPGNPMGFAKSKAEIQMIPDTGVSFDDVAGCDGAKLELAEVVDFLKQPEAYTNNGCKIPQELFWMDHLEQVR